MDAGQEGHQPAPRPVQRAAVRRQGCAAQHAHVRLQRGTRAPLPRPNCRVGATVAAAAAAPAWGTGGLRRHAAPAAPHRAPTAGSARPSWTKLCATAPTGSWCSCPPSEPSCMLVVRTGTLHAGWGPRGAWRRRARRRRRRLCRCVCDAAPACGRQVLPRRPPPIVERAAAAALHPSRPCPRRRRASVSNFKGKWMVNVREYYEKDGEMLVGAGGCSCWCGAGAAVGAPRARAAAMPTCPAGAACVGRVRGL